MLVASRAESLQVRVNFPPTRAAPALICCAEGPHMTAQYPYSYPPPPPYRQSRSGFIWDDGGDIVTNFHVVRGASAARVTLQDHTAYQAQLVGVAPENDLAVLRISAPKSKLQPIMIGKSSDLQVGQRVFAIGDP